MSQGSRAAVLALAATWLLAGCKPDAAVKTGAEIGAGSAAQQQPGPNAPQTPNGTVPDLGAGPARPSIYKGTITGDVLFAGKAPAPVEIDTSMDPACSLASTGKVYSEQYVVHNGKLANVFVYIKAGPDAAMTLGPETNQPVVLDQRGCQYVPHVIAVMQGGTVEFRNSDATMHNIHTMPATVGNEVIDVSQDPRGVPVLKRMAKPELMMPVRCNNHPWMNAFINVAPTPFFAVTNADGKFTIGGLPPGQYTLGFVQEKLGEKTVQVNVPKDGTAKATMTFGQ